VDTRANDVFAIGSKPRGKDWVFDYQQLIRTGFLETRSHSHEQSQIINLSKERSHLSRESRAIWAIEVTRLCRKTASNANRPARVRAWQRELPKLIRGAVAKALTRPAYLIRKQHHAL
jgi:hypothetical protein